MTKRLILQKMVIKIFIKRSCLIVAQCGQYYKLACIHNAFSTGLKAVALWVI